MIKRFGLAILSTICLLLTGCRDSAVIDASKSKVSNIEDIYIKRAEEGDFQVITEEGKSYWNDDAIVFASYNEFYCVDTLVEYNEDTGEYTCTAKFKKVVE